MGDFVEQLGGRTYLGSTRFLLFMSVLIAIIQFLPTGMDFFEAGGISNGLLFDTGTKKREGCGYLKKQGYFSKKKKKEMK